MRAGIVVNVTRADRRRLEAIVADRGAPQKHVWRANIILATADGCGTAVAANFAKLPELPRRPWNARADSGAAAGAFSDRPFPPSLHAHRASLPTALVTMRFVDNAAHCQRLCARDCYRSSALQSLSRLRMAECQCLARTRSERPFNLVGGEYPSDAMAGTSLSHSNPKTSSCSVTMRQPR